MTGSSTPRSVVFIVPDARIDRIDRAWAEAYRALALDLRAAGASVTMAIANGDEPVDSCWDELTGAGIVAVAIPAPRLRTQHVERNAPQARAYRVYEWLKGQPADVVHAPSTGGLAFYCLAAKRCAVAFAGTAFAIHAARTELTREEARLHPLSGLQPLSLDHLERRSLEWADGVWSHVPARFDALAEAGARIDAQRTAVLPVPGSVGADAPAAGAPRHGRTIVLLGPIERSGGLALLRDALARLPRADLPAKVKLVGPRPRKFDAEEFLHRRIAGTAVEIEIVPSATWAEAMPHLDAADLVLALVGADWMAHGIVRRLTRGHPLLVLETSPLVSLIAPDERGAVTVSTNPNDLAAAIARREAPTPPRPGTDPMPIWADWHRSLAAARPARPATARGGPRVSVCLIHHERPDLLMQALESIRRQDWPDVEVVLVDDGSQSRAARDALEALAPEFATRGWKIVRQPNAYLGAARNTAVRHASGAYVLFLDDDNVLKPGAIRTFVTAAEASGADIVTSFCDVWEGEDAPAEERVRTRLVFEGDNVALGLFVNAFGDSNALVRRDAFVDVGGNSEDFGVGKDDQEFFARAVLAGKRLVHVPEALYWYRISATRLRHRHFSDNAGHFRVLRPYLEAASPELRPLIALAQGLALATRGGRRLGAADRTGGEFGSDEISTLSHDLAFDTGSYRFVRKIYRLQIGGFAALMRLEARLARAATAVVKRLRG